MTRYFAIIPARYASSRLPGKPLRLLAGRPMLEHTWRAATASAAQQVIIATDDKRIREVAEGFGACVVMTSADHASGSDRIAEVARQRGWMQDEIIVNVQCDEPMLPPQLIDQVASTLSSAGDIATLSTPFSAATDINDPNAVKVVMDERGRALYFSRAAIPYDRESPGSGNAALRHLGLYAYRAASLHRLCALPVATLERLERLEQLRALSAGMVIDIAIAACGPGPGVDTEEDLAHADKIMREQQ
ncbi:MAG: 3-deoxy-manno-octulosonate cytidylyltransferase [Gammaproteobacteria bacterium]|nr:3-deoxy-manno-octulosonate cytidylyltransferase [Gammaproteobacteria bacterium]